MAGQARISLPLSKWRYSGQTDLILTNARYLHYERRAVLDFSRAIVCKLDAMIKNCAIESVAAFFEEVFRYAEDAHSNDPVWDFSDVKGLHVARWSDPVYSEPNAKEC